MKLLAAAAGLALLAGCQPDSDKTNPAVATEDDRGARELAAPAEGATSFTEGQARDRIMQAGYANVGALTKTPEGAWQGSAELNGQPVTVVVDYQGNVTTR